MKINISLILVIILATLSCSSQNYKSTIKTGHTNEVEYRVEKLLLVDNETYFVQNEVVLDENLYGKKTLLNPVVVKYNKAFNEIASLDLNKRFKSKCQVVCIQNNLYVVSENRDEKNKKSLLVANSIDKENLTVNEDIILLAELPYESLSFPGSFRVVENSENLKIAVIAKTELRKSANNILVKIFSNELQEVFSNKQDLASNTNLGFEHILFEHSLSILMKNVTSGNDFMSITIDSENQEIDKSTFKLVDNVSSSMIIADGKNLTVLHTLKDEGKFIISTFEGNKHKSKSISNDPIFENINSLKFSQSVQTEDGCILLFEEDWSSPEQVSKNRQVSFGNVLVAKCNFDGEIIWSQMIEKKQESSQSLNFISYKAIDLKNSIDVLHNSKQGLIVNSIDKESGNLTNSKTLENQKRIFTESIFKIDDNSVLLFSKTGTKTVLSTLKLK